MRRYRKTDVDTHGTGYYGPSYPAVNVKTSGLTWGLPDKVQEEFNCSESVAEKALKYWFDSAQRQFWEYWQDTSGDLENGLYGSPEYAYFPGHKVTIESEGRSGGWLVVKGLPDLEEWDTVMLARWRKFEKGVQEDVKYRCSWEAVKEEIEANRWAEEGAELYNFITTKSGRNVCIAEVNRALDELRRLLLA